jgi:hypothetical protein
MIPEISASITAISAGSAVVLGGWLLAALLLAPAPESLRVGTRSI